MDAPHHHATFEDLRSALEALRTKLLANQMEFANQVDGLHKAIESMVREAAAERENAEELTRVAEDKLSAFVAYLQDKEDEAGDGESRMEELSQRVAELEQDLAGSEERAAARQQQYADEAAAAGAARERVGKLERELAKQRSESDARIAAMEQELAESKQELDAARSQQVDQSTVAEAARERVAELESELTDKTSEGDTRVAALERSLTERTAERESALTELEQVREELEQARANAEAAESVGAGAREEIAQLQEQLDASAKDLAEREEAVEALTRDKAALAKKVDSLEQSLAGAADAAALEKDVEELRQQLQEERVRADLLEQQLRDETAKGTKSVLAEQLAEALRDADQVREELRELRASHALGATPPEPPEPPEPVETVERVEPKEWPADPMARIRDAAQHLEGSHRRTLGAILVDAGIVEAAEIEAALEEQRANPQTHVGAILVERGLASEEAVGLALACQSQVDFVALDENTIDPQAPALVSERLAQKHSCIPIQASVDTVVLAMSNPLDLVAIEDVERASNRKVEVVVATNSDIARALEQYYWEPE